MGFGTGVGTGMGRGTGDGYATAATKAGVAIARLVQLRPKTLYRWAAADKERGRETCNPAQHDSGSERDCCSGDMACDHPLLHRCTITARNAAGVSPHLVVSFRTKP